MRRSKRQLDEQIDRLLAGDETPGMEEEVAALVSRLQAESQRREPAYSLARTLAAEASRAESVPAGTRSRTVRPLPTRWRRRIMLSTFLSSLFGKLAVGAVALATTGSLAATGNLPDPVQDWTADRLAVVGIEIPDPDNEADETAHDVLEVIENGDPEDGEEFGQDVADTASEGKSSDGLDTAEGQDENANVADDQVEVAGDGADVELPGQAESGSDYEVPDEAGSGSENGSSPRP